VRSTEHLRKWQHPERLRKLGRRAKVIRAKQKAERDASDAGRVARLFAFLARSDAEYQKRRDAGLLAKRIPSVTTSRKPS
jgi:hypothetical protein